MPNDNNPVELLQRNLTKRLCYLEMSISIKVVIVSLYKLV